jgi:hypothetical protein
LCKETSQISGNLLSQSSYWSNGWWLKVKPRRLGRDDSALDFPFFGSGIMLMTIDDYMKANIFCCAQLQLQSIICWRGSSVAQQSSNIKGERAQAVGPSRPDFAVLSDAKYVQYPVLEGHKMSLMTVDVGFYCNHRIGFSNRKPKVAVDSPCWWMQRDICWYHLSSHTEINSKGVSENGYLKVAFSMGKVMINQWI